VIVIDNGEIAAKGTPSVLKQAYATDKLRLTCHDFDAVKEILQKAGVAYRQIADQLIVNLEKTLDALPLLSPCEPFISSFEVISGTMDDAFIGITGKELRQ
jgi:multidrug/hemolysin transport system ATP-binding protein